MVRKCLLFAVVAAVAGITLTACSGNGPSEPMGGGDDMPMQVIAADSIGR